MPQVCNRGVQINYRVCGQGEPLVLIHGWSCEGRYWDEFGYVSQLQAEFTVVVPDLRGHGSSGSPADHDFSDAAFASDIVAVIDDLGIDSTHLFGYSLGGWVVFELAANVPSRIKTAIIGGAHPYAEDLSGLRNLSLSNLAGAWEAMGAPLSSGSKGRILAFDLTTLTQMVPNRTDKSGRMGIFDGPWLMICGTNDPRFEGMRRLAATTDHCDFVPVDEADHLQAWFRSGHIVPAVRMFLSQPTT